MLCYAILCYTIPPVRGNGSDWVRQRERLAEVIGKSVWVFITGGCCGRGLQRMGAVLCNKLVYNSIHITTPCFHCTPL